MTIKRPFALKSVGRAARALARPVLAKYGLSEAALSEQWAEIVGPEWSRIASPRHFARASGTLTLRVSGAHALELAHAERELIARINGFSGRELVKRLKIVQGPLGEPLERLPRRSLVPPAPEGQPVHKPEGLAEALANLGRAIKSR